MSESIAGQETPVENEQAKPQPPFSWRLWLLILALNLVASVLILPYAVALQPTLNQMSWVVLVLSQVLSGLLINGPLAAVGLWAGKPIDLGAPLLHDWLHRMPVAQRLKKAIPLAFVIGLIVGLALVALGTALSPLVNAELTARGLNTPELQEKSSPAPWKGLLASISAGITEETLLRLFGLTVLAWIGTRLFRTGRPTPALLWAANLISALVFASMHLPQVVSLGLLTPLMVINTLLLNSIAGLAFGWLYWRYGLLAAMTAHMSTDLILHVLVPAVTLLVRG